jgi:hypothetical protein
MNCNDKRVHDNESDTSTLAAGQTRWSTRAGSSAKCRGRSLVTVAKSPSHKATLELNAAVSDLAFGGLTIYADTSDCSGVSPTLRERRRR